MHNTRTVLSKLTTLLKFAISIIDRGLDGGGGEGRIHTSVPSPIDVICSLATTLQNQLP